MPKLTYADEKREVEFSEAQSILEISNENQVEHLHVCGGLGRCSTCRVQILNGLEIVPSGLRKNSL